MSRSSTEHRTSSRHCWLLTALVVLLSLFTAGPAQAATTTISVVNERGVPQAGVVVSGFSADGNGQLTINVNPGQVLNTTRDLGGGDPCSATPEGPAGVDYTVPDPVPAELTITLPNLPLSPYEPALSNRERGLIGLINQQRATQGIPPLYISLTLNESADRYVSAIPDYFSGITNSQAHCAVSGPGIRMLDTGFPLTGSWRVSENITWAGSATETFRSWMGSLPHKEAILNPAFNAVGVANRGDKWIIDLATINNSSPFVYRAQMTTDTGDPALADKGSNEELEGEGSELSDPHLGFAWVRIKHKRIRVGLKLAPGSSREGRVELVARQGKRQRPLTLNQQLRAQARLGRGHWTLQAKFIPSAKDNYLSSSITRQLRIRTGS